MHCNCRTQSNARHCLCVLSDANKSYLLTYFVSITTIMHYIKKFNVEHDNYMICANTDLLAFNQSDIYNGTVTKVSSNVKMDVFMHIANV